MRSRILACSLILTPLLASQAQAVSLNMTATADYWSPSVSGYIQGNSNQQELDLKDNLGFSSEAATNLSLQLDHFIPWVPNLRLTQTNLDFSGTQASGFEFRDQTFTGKVSSDLDLSHTDFTAYYRFLDGATALLPLVSLRLEAGLTLRLFDGGIDITEVETGNNESVDLSAPVPMGYVGGLVSFPKGFAAGARLNYISYSDTSLSDFDLFARYEYQDLPLITPGVTAGYRSWNLEMDDLDDVYGDLTLKGPHLGAYIRVGF